MSVIAFVDGSAWDDSVIQHASWAAQAIDQSLTIITQDGTPDREPAIAYDAYQQMNPQEDMYRELAAQPMSQFTEMDTAALEIVQNAARNARDRGVARVRTATTSDPVPYYIENSTDSGDLLVAARGDNDSGSRKMDQFLKVRSRVILLVPESFTPIASWMIGIDGKPAIGRVVDFLCNRQLLSDTSGTAVIVGNDYQSRIHFRDAVRHLQSSNHEIRSHELQGNADDVLAAVLAVSPVDLLVMGAYGEGRFRLLNERSTTSRLLKTFRGPVLLARA